MLKASLVGDLVSSCIYLHDVERSSKKGELVDFVGLDLKVRRGVSMGTLVGCLYGWLKWSYKFVTDAVQRERKSS